MWKNIGYEQCRAYVRCHLHPEGAAGGRRAAAGPAVTISRTAGAGGLTIASNLADYLQRRMPGDCRWTVFDRNLMEQVLEDHHLPKRLVELLPESHKPMLQDALEEFLGLHPSSWAMAEQTAETILRLAQAGHVILVGRGANVVTRHLDHVFHVRLTGSVERRLERLSQAYGFDREQAEDYLRREDAGRRRYLKEHFGQEIDDPLLYHLVINTDRVDDYASTRLIGDEVINRFSLDRRLEAVAA